MRPEQRLAAARSGGEPLDDYTRWWRYVPGANWRHPRGPATSFDPDEPAAAERVTRGGSFLCSGEYCSRYLVGSRGRAEISSGSSNLGFRLVSDRARVDGPARPVIARLNDVRPEGA